MNNFFSPKESVPVETVTFLTDGRMFEVSRTSLSNVAFETFPVSACGSYILDENTDCVTAIFNYYRTGQLHVPQVCISVFSHTTEQVLRSVCISLLLIEEWTSRTKIYIVTHF